MRDYSDFDLYQVESLLTDEERMVRDSVRAWVLNGEKAWITNGTIADVAVVWARTDEGIRSFLVERGTPGFETFEHKGKYSLRVSVTSQLAFEPSAE